MNTTNPNFLKQQSQQKHSANLMVMTEQTPNAKKGKPTPARKQQEAARKRPLVAPKTPEARKAERAAMRERRLEASRGLANGDPKYLPKRDLGAQRSMLRDIVDSRFITAGEVLMETRSNPEKAKRPSGPLLVLLRCSVYRLSGTRQAGTSS